MKTLENGLKMKSYYLDSKYGCGLVTVKDDGYIDRKQTCPLYTKIFGRGKFRKIFDSLKRNGKIKEFREI